MPVLNGSCVYTTWEHEHIIICRWQWVSDSDGDVIYRMDEDIHGIPWTFITIPCAVDAPTLNYDITIKALCGCGDDILLGNGANRSDTDTEKEWITDSSITAAHTMAHGKHVFKVETAGDTKSGSAILRLIKEDSITNPATLY